MRRALPNRTPLYIAAGVIVGFLIGFFWQFTVAQSARGELGDVRHELTFQRLEATLGAAAIEAHRGGYETGRQLASQFFSGLQQEIQNAPVEAQATLRDMLDRRDAMITALSRNDPQSGPLLSQLFIRFRSTFGRQVGPDVGTTPAPPRDTVPDTAGAGGGGGAGAGV
jgi:hypothetical protein